MHGTSVKMHSSTLEFVYINNARFTDHIRLCNVNINQVTWQKGVLVYLKVLHMERSRNPTETSTRRNYVPLTCEVQLQTVLLG